jgi:hypothetical protein
MVEHEMGMKFPEKKPGQSFAFWFHWNLETIERAYRASRNTPDTELADSRKREAKLRKAIAAGKAFWVDYDENGHPGFDYGEQLGEEQHAHEQSLSLIRLAFLITLHHYWEQKLAQQLPRSKKGNLHYDLEAAFAWLEAFGWKPLRDRLNELRLIANCAKHSEGPSAAELYALRPDLFDTQEIEKWGLIPGYETLLISDADTTGYFEAVSASIPRMPMSL